MQNLDAIDHAETAFSHNANTGSLITPNAVRIHCRHLPSSLDQTLDVIAAEAIRHDMPDELYTVRVEQAKRKETT